MGPGGGVRGTGRGLARPAPARFAVGFGTVRRRGGPAGQPGRGGAAGRADHRAAARGAAPVPRGHNPCAATTFWSPRSTPVRWAEPMATIARVASCTKSLPTTVFCRAAPRRPMKVGRLRVPRARRRPGLARRWPGPSPVMPGIPAQGAASQGAVALSEPAELDLVRPQRPMTLAGLVAELRVAAVEGRPRRRGGALPMAKAGVPGAHPMGGGGCPSCPMTGRCAMPPTSSRCG
jgi:hypothetical protein